MFVSDGDQTHPLPDKGEPHPVRGAVLGLDAVANELQ
jgi:hypothetical protein